MILDAHTHVLPALPGSAIVSVNADDWQPQPGQWYAIGIHPWEIKESGGEQLARLRALLDGDTSGQIRMVGETGLDRRRGPALEIQRNVFREQLKIAHSIGINPVIHDVHAMADLLAVRRELHDSSPWLIHGFRGGPEQARQYLRAGCHVSLGIHFRLDTLLTLPPDELFLESDEDTDSLPILYERVSEALHIPLETLQQQVNENVLHLLGT